MAFDTDDVGLVLEVVTKPTSGADADPQTINLVLQASENAPPPAFQYGIFPTKLMVLLVAAKNKFKGIKVKGLNDKATVEEVKLTGLVLPNGTDKNFGGLLTYSTLPFVYICDNDLGKGGFTIPMYEFPSSGKTLTSQKAVTLNRDNGNFFLAPNASTLDVSAFKAGEINKEDFAASLIRYNGEFIDSGVDAGDLLQQLWNQSRFSSQTFPFRNVIFADVLDEIANRWFKSSGSTKDYNIGASLYVENGAGQSAKYKPLMTSLNIKSVNKAAHAEVRIALLLDFLTKYTGSSGATLSGTPLEKWRYEVSDASIALKAITTPDTEVKKLGLFSSLLPCYMCLGNVESTVGGFIKSINGQPVGMDATFDGVSQTALIVDTEYYDIDSTIEYRNIDIFKKPASSGESDELIATVHQLNVSEPLVSNVTLTLTTDPSISPFPMSISNAGSDEVGIGLQNRQSMQRYNLASATMQLVHGKTAKLVIDDTTGGASGGAASTSSSRRILADVGPAAVHSYSA